MHVSRISLGQYRSTLELPGVRVLGCTLWSGFGLYGPERISISMSSAYDGITITV